MKKFLIFSAVVVLLFAFSGLGQAATFNYTVTLNDLVDKANTNATTKFAWDWDEEAPIGTTAGGGAPGYGSSAFWSDVQGSAAGGNGRDYTALRLFPSNIFNTASLTIGDLSEISYWTKWTSGVDWQLKIYTQEADPSDPGWYGHRFNFDRPTPSDNNWNEYSTAGTLDVDWIRSGAGVSDYPANTSLTDLHSTYGTETILFIDIISSYMTDSPAGDSYLDGVEMTLMNGDNANLNLAVVPEPISSTLFLVGAATLGFRRFRKTNKA